MKIMRSLAFCVALLAHLIGSAAYAAPRLVEICTAHGVEYRIALGEVDADKSCDICIAVCDLAAIETDQTGTVLQLPVSTRAANGGREITERSTPRGKSRGPPAFA